MRLRDEAIDLLAELDDFEAELRDTILALGSHRARVQMVLDHAEFGKAAHVDFEEIRAWLARNIEGE